jgi:hypothetical protein
MSMFGNQLTMALQLIPRFDFQVTVWTGRVSDDRGIDADTYAVPVTVSGHVQAVNRAKYEKLGLDFQKQYVRVYSDSQVMADIYRDRNPDAITWQGSNYKPTSVDDWMQQDGWQRVTCVRV